MSNLEAIRPPRHRRTRPLALGAVIAVGAIALILALSGANQAIGVAQARPFTPLAALALAAPAGSFHEPTTQGSMVTARVAMPPPSERCTP